MLLTVSGPPGGGKSTLASRLAAERDMTPLEFNRLAEEDDRIDRDLDRRLRETAVQGEDLVLESRLAGWLAGDHADLRLWLDAPLEVRAARIAEREGITAAEARADTTDREQSEAKRYREYYDIDVDDLSIYDLTLNTGRWDFESEVAIVLTAVESYDASGDEGAVPVETSLEL